MYLPEGAWANLYDTRSVLAGPRTVTADAPQERLPAFVKMNSVYPTGLVYDGTRRTWDTQFAANRTVTINAFPGAPGQSTAFTYVDYLDGDRPKEITLSSTSSCKVRVAFPALTVGGTVKVLLGEGPGSLLVNGRPVDNTRFDVSTGMVSVPFTSGGDVEVVLEDASTVAGTVPMPPASLSNRGLRVHLGSALTELTWRTSAARVLRLSVFDASGRQVSRRMVPAGTASVHVEGPGSGLRVVRVTSPDGTVCATGRVMLP
jgi:hypothetical protein